jgi:hypothetical protein
MQFSAFRFFQWFSVFLLLLNAAGALPAGILFMIDPSGVLMGTPIDMLKNSPFTTFLIPGIILFIANGLFSLIALFFLLRKQWPIFTTLQGVILIGWLAIQVYMIQTISPLHVVMAVVGVLLVVSGSVLFRIRQQSQQ